MINEIMLGRKSNNKSLKVVSKKIKSYVKTLQKVVDFLDKGDFSDSQANRMRGDFEENSRNLNNGIYKASSIIQNWPNDNK